MGLSFNRTSARWTYGAFHEFRKRLAKQAEIPLMLMDGYGPDGAGLSWRVISDPIAPLLNHSDNDGEISAENCKRIAPRLRDLVATWDDKDNDKYKALLLAAGMDFCAESGRSLIFL